MTSVRSSLSRFQPQSRMDAGEIEQAKREAWQREGIVVARPEEIGSEWLARGMTAWANERYGQRRK